MRHHLILRVVSKLLIPFILLFALYVQFHGDFGPGGGFQAGVIFATAFILYALIFGRETAARVVPPHVLQILLASGVLIYASVGVAGIVMGANFLDYSVLFGHGIEGQHIGINLIEFGVGTTVAAVMIMVFFMFTGRGR
jgi:multicomponent Na+:H+ antiporter subunit B